MLLVFTLLLFAGFSASCKEDLSITEFGVYEGGVNVSQVNLRKESAYQLSYQVTLTYPDKNVFEFYKKKLFPVGWRVCVPEGDWDTQLKKDSGQIKGVRQIVNYAIHRQSNRLLMISLQYHSDPIPQPYDKIEWHDDIQYVTLVAYNTQNLNKLLNVLSISCPE
jgi:hypothetical protein